VRWSGGDAALSEVSVSVTIDDTRHLDAIVARLGRFAEVSVEQRMAIVCAVGETLRADPAIFRRAVTALAGIPLTHRGLASGFAVLSGHSPSAWQPILDSVAPGALSLVVLMGLRARGELAAALLARGWRPGTPAALLFAASTPSAHAWTGTLAELAEAPIPAASDGAPATLVVGEVVALAASTGLAAAPAQDAGWRVA